MPSDRPIPDRSPKPPEGVRVELPLVIGVLADLAGNAPTHPLTRLRERDFLEIDRDSYADFLRSVAPGLSLVGRDFISRTDQDRDASLTLAVTLRIPGSRGL